MTVRLPNGTTFEVAASYGPAKAFTAITNAKPAKAASVAHGFAKGAVLEISSGWARLDGRVARARMPSRPTLSRSRASTPRTPMSIRLARVSAPCCRC
ncbi:hypothetical protein [Ralstonia pseudosolanacearum]|uniref:hypothetical protein n=1 Tax=Ralstonia pseudosolanacearum TaxID=1310165 RepID=UPI002234ACBE|nr:hypothetical protein [Ralstonia sp. RS642]